MPSLSSIDELPVYLNMILYVEWRTVQIPKLVEMN